MGETEMRGHEVLFIDASEMGYMKDRTHRGLSDNTSVDKLGNFDENGLGDIQKITNTYHNWRKDLSPSGRYGSEGIYQDVKGYCKSATLEEIQKHGHVLTPGRYVGIPDEIDDGIPFETKMADLTATLKEQMDKEAELNQEIATQLSKIGFTL